MTRLQHPLELLAPAKNADIGIEAIKHGADAVYIGGPAFGARPTPSNTVADIRRLVRFRPPLPAPGSSLRCNTILHDAELEPARQLIRQLYEAGVDALIVQDMGLLELDLPPIQLARQHPDRHPQPGQGQASSQTSVSRRSCWPAR